MAAPQLTAHSGQDPQNPQRATGGRALLLVLVTFIVLLGTNYTTLTNDGFRNWAIQQLPSGFRLSGGLMARKADPLIVRAMEREAALKAEIRALKGNAAALKVEVAGLQNVNASLAAQERSARARLIVTEEKRLMGVAAAERLGTRMKARVAKGLARQLATLPGKVAPAIGAAVVVGSAILEVRDLCENMQDMAELNAKVGLPAIDSREVCGVQIGTVQTVVDNAKQNMAATYASAMRAAGLAPSLASVPVRGLPDTTAASLPGGAVNAVSAGSKGTGNRIR
jgi:hypothetical protein